MRHRAIFLDRDGTLVHSRHYPSRPEDLVLYADIASELRLLQEAGFRLVIITNQSGIARGYFTATDLQRMHDDLELRLAQVGITITAFYHCPHHPDGAIPELSVRCDCRKPAPGMLLRAAAELDIDLERSWFAGDILDDVEAGNRAGCRTVLVDLGTESLPTRSIRRPDFVARTTRHALQIIRTMELPGPAVDTGIDAAVDLTYRPSSWLEPALQTVVSGGRNGR